MSKNMLVIIAVVSVLLVGGVLLINNSKTTTPSPLPAATQSTTDTMPEMSPESAMTDSSASGAATTEGTVKEFTVMGSNFKFEPATLSVNKGDKVKITYKSTGGIHDFVIDDFNVQSKSVAANQETTVEFTADKAGSFEYYCSIGNHRQMGMKGTLVVK